MNFWQEQSYINIGQQASINEADIVDLKDGSGGIFKEGHGQLLALFKRWIQAIYKIMIIPY